MWVSVLLLGAAEHLVSELPAGAEGMSGGCTDPRCINVIWPKRGDESGVLKRFGSECS